MFSSCNNEVYKLVLLQYMLNSIFIGNHLLPDEDLAAFHWSLLGPEHPLASLKVKPLIKNKNKNRHLAVYIRDAQVFAYVILPVFCLFFLPIFPEVRPRAHYNVIICEHVICVEDVRHQHNKHRKTDRLPRREQLLV